LGATYGFDLIPSDKGNPNVGGSLWVDVTSAPADVSFKFYWSDGVSANGVAAPGNIQDIYFSVGGGLADLTGTSNSAFGTVSFSEGAAPPILPGGSWNAAFSADANTPNQTDNGVNYFGEWVMITFQLALGASFQDVLDSLNSGDFRLGIHVQSIVGTGGSDAYINLSPVPLPPALLLFGTVLAGYGYLTRRRRMAAAQPAH
jgi:hypothetical protein